MKASKLPGTIIPERLATHEESLIGSLFLKDMPRLVSSLHQPGEQEAEIELKFAKDQQNLVIIHGKIRASLPLLCQRCFESMQYPLDTEFDLSPVSSQAGADNLPVQYEPLLMDEESILLADIIEEELLLSLPLVPMHLPEECPVKLDRINDDVTLKPKKNPFEVLKDFKKS